VSAPLRGQVYRVDLGYGLKPWLVVSNNSRNRNLETVIAVRITTTDKNADLPTVVPLNQADPLIGYVLVDDLIPLYRDELTTYLGSLSGNSMSAVSDALRIALP
jgi:mRNA interferase MazF